MKKIIATVLAMVMALALCTTAFAANNETLKADDGYAIISITDLKDVAEGKDITKAAGSTTVTYDSKTGDKVTTIVPDMYTDGRDTPWTYYETDASVAGYKLMKGNTIVAYLKDTSTPDTVKATKTASSFVAAKAEKDRTCGDYLVDVYMIDGVAYAASGSDYALYNGKVVTIGAKVTNAVDHKFDKAQVTYKSTTDNTVVAIKCDTCGKTFEVVSKLPANYVGSYGRYNGAYILYGNVATTPSTNTTTSPKTFDAGIAMYVGMALTSVAGSAVVIGKKKEF